MRSTVGPLALSLVLALPAIGRAQVASGPTAHVLVPPPATSYGARVGNELSIAPFDPSDPRVGLGLAAAYAPSPFLLVDVLVAPEVDGRQLSIVELTAGVVGAVFSAAAFVDTQLREVPSDVSFASLATAHALAWNLELVTRAGLRLVLGTDRVEPFAPVVVAFPVIGGAAVAPRWEW